MSFEKFNLSQELGMGLSDLKFEEPTPIQEECIPLILEGHDVIGAAQTGTGKTGAFVIPIIQKIMENKGDFTQALILSPTRELAQQIDEQIFALGYHTPVTSATIIGGSDFAAQAKSIRANVDIIVATPGRLLDQMNVTGIDFSKLNYLVLDEADRMLDMGFIPDVTSIVNSLPKERQTMLFSATMSGEVMKVVDKVMKPNPRKVEFEISKPVDSVDQRAYFTHPKDKLKLIEHLFDTLEWETCIIFTATKKGTDELERTLKKRDIPAISMHGDRSQEERNEALRAFKNKKFPVMVATDVLSRGIDIDNISLIINYDVPNTTDDYIHRVGRTGRYDKTGRAVTFVTNRDKKYFSDIKRVVKDQLTIYEDVQGILSGKVDDSGSGGKRQQKQSGSGKSSGSDGSRDSDRKEKKDPKKEQGPGETKGSEEKEKTEQDPTGEEDTSKREEIDRSRLPERPGPSGKSRSEKKDDENGESGDQADSQSSKQPDQHPHSQSASDNGEADSRKQDTRGESVKSPDSDAAPKSDKSSKAGGDSGDGKGGRKSAKKDSGGDDRKSDKKSQKKSEAKNKGKSDDSGRREDGGRSSDGKKESSHRASGRTGRQDRSRNGDGDASPRGKRTGRSASGRAKRLPDHLQHEIVEKAVNRNQRARKPAKGLWGIIKSLIPKIKS